MDILTSFINVAPYINQLCREEVTVAIADLEKHLAYYPAPGMAQKVDIPIGTPLKEGQALTEAIKKGHSIKSNVPPSVWGIPIYSVAIPLQDDQGKIVGAVTFATDTGYATRLDDIIQGLNNDSASFATIVEGLATSSEESSNRAQEAVMAVEKALVYSRKTEEILHIMAKTASQSNLIGLNAAIESARAGASGKVFSIVADEIRKLAQETASAIKDVRSIIEELNATIGIIAQTVGESAVHAADQKAIGRETASSISALRGRMEMLAQLSREIQ